MAKAFEFVTHLDALPDDVWAAVRKPALFLHVAAPLVTFRPLGMERFPDHWREQEYRGAMKLFGVLPLGWQAIVISFPPAAGDMRILEDNGFSPMLPRWSHRIEVSSQGTGTRYADRICFDAGAMTAIQAPAIRFFFKHRQRRLRAIAAKGFAGL